MAARHRRKVGITRFDGAMVVLGALLVAAVGGLLWLSQQMVAPPRVRVSESSRPVIGVTLRERKNPGRLEVIRCVSPAKEAGLRPGDRIVRIDSLEKPDLQAFVDAVQQAPAGHRFTIEARRGDPGAESGVLVDVVAVERRVSPADEGLVYEDVELKDADGLVLRGWFVPGPRGVRAPAVAYGHGNGADRRQWLPAAAAVHDAGIAQLLIDFAGRGESDGDVITLGAHESADLRSALDWLAARKDVDPSRLALAGKSMGAAAAILAAADDTRVKALVLDSPFADLGVLVDGVIAERHLPPRIVRPLLFAIAGWRAHFDPASVRPVEAIRRVKAPALLLHGDKDDVVPFDDAKLLEKAAGGPLTFIPLEGLDHNTARPAEVYERVAKYLAGALD